MYKFQNGSKCPCCGGVIEEKSQEWLDLFSQLMSSKHLEPIEEEIVLEPVSGFPPPDAGINPPIKPISLY